MGLLGGERKVYVSSVAYNLGGPLEDRPNFVKSLVIGSTLKNSKSMADDLVGGHLSGPGFSQTAFYRWARRSYPEGSCVNKTSQSISVPVSAVEDEIFVPAGATLEVQAAFVDMGEIEYWAERWFMDNDPARFPDAWVADYDPGTLELVIYYPGEPELRVSETEFESDAKFVYAYYRLTLADLSQVDKLFIYKIGSGNADLDALDVDVELAAEVFPVIPLRINGKHIDHGDFADMYQQNSKAFKKATGTDIEEIIASIKDNKDVKDIDYAFLVHGVELNTQENCGKRYLFEFFRSMIPNQKTTPLELANWISSALGYKTQAEALAAWEAAQSDPEHPLYGSARPTMPVRSELEVTRFEVKTGERVRYKAHTSWVTMQETVETGLGKPDATKGDFWFEILPNLEIPGVPINVGGNSVEGAKGALGRFRLYWQEQDAIHRIMTVYGMFHQNFVFEGKTVNISAKAALEELDESGFVVPLHYPTLKKLSLVSSTQLSISSRIVVFNCYEVVRTRWYETGIFRLVFIVIVAAVSALVFPAGIGLLGSNLAVGTALGASGSIALMIGGIANAVAAMVLVQVIELGAVALFGEELGLIIGAIASFMTMQYVSGFMTTGSWTFNIGEMTKAENLLKLTDAVSGGVSKWAAWKAGELQEAGAEAYEDYLAASQAVENKSLEEFGYGQAMINPLFFMQLGGSTSIETIGPMATESSEDFLRRTLMTGSDIVEMSLAITKNFPALALTLPDSSI